MWEERWQFGVGGGRSGEFPGEDLQEERVKLHLGGEQARSVQRACLREHSQCEWNRMKEGQRGERGTGTRGPQSMETQSFARP